MSKRTKYRKGNKPPAFILKLYQILQDQVNFLIVKWREDEQSFIILNIPRFSQIILPKYYKHANFSSFVRQLHMYNFTKMRVQIQGEHVYKNQIFFRGNIQNFKEIRRKEVNNSKNNLLALTNNLNNQIESNMDQESVFERQSRYSIAAPSQTPQQNPWLFHRNSQISNVSFQYSPDNLSQHNFTIPLNIPNVIPLPSNDNRLEYLQNILVQMKTSQNQLQEICLSLYKQNKTLTSQNKLLQEKVCREWHKKQNNLNKIMKYVVQYLQQWNNQQSYFEFKQTQGDKCDNFQFNDVIAQSYQAFTKNKKLKSRSKKFQTDKTNMFKKYSKTDLMNFLKQIESIFRSNVLFSQLFQENQPVESNFLSMIMKFVENNQLTQVLKAFSMFMNIQRNRKKKNYTVIDKKQKMQIQKNQDLIQVQNLHAIELQYLEHERKCIKQMQQQIIMIEECQQLKHSSSPQSKKTKNKMQQQSALKQNYNERRQYQRDSTDKVASLDQQIEMDQILNNFKYFLE